MNDLLNTLDAENELEEGDEGACSCGYPVVWTGDEWQHDAAPWRWGDDHDVNLVG
jgi:hypothetical protein